MNFYLGVIAGLALTVAILFCNWLYAKSCVKFWHMMYREEQRHSENLYKHVKRLEDRCMFTSRPRDSMQSFVNSLGTPKHEQGDGKALAEDPAPYYALNMMAKAQPKEEHHD